MKLEPDWIIAVLRDLQAFAEENCRPEVCFHLEGARKHIKPYISRNPPVTTPDPQAQSALDVLEALIRFARSRKMPEMRVHLMAAKRNLLENKDPGGWDGEVITFPVSGTPVIRRQS